MRDDIRGRRAPRELTRFLARRYGKNEFGEPNFRLVWAPSRLERSGGLWRGRELGMRWLPKYSGDGWLIEAWRPAWCYGSPERWYAPVAEGGTRLMGAQGSVCTLGDYPSRGDYEDIGARMQWMPTERHLEAAIWRWRQSLNSAATLAQRVRRRNAAAERRAERIEASFDAEADAVMSDADFAFGGAPMAAYGAKRRPALVSMAESIGIGAHPY